MTDGTLNQLRDGVRITFATRIKPQASQPKLTSKSHHLSVNPKTIGFKDEQWTHPGQMRTDQSKNLQIMDPDSTMQDVQDNQAEDESSNESDGGFFEK